MDELCRHNNITASQLNEWRDIFINKGKDGFRKNADDHRLKDAQVIIGHQAIELDIIQ